MEFKKIPKGLHDKFRDEICKMIEADLRSDPNCPAGIKAGLKVVKALRALDEASSDMVQYLDELVRADDVGHVKELEQYVELVTTGIRQYLAAMKGNGGAP